MKHYIMNIQFENEQDRITAGQAALQNPDIKVNVNGMMDEEQLLQGVALDRGPLKRFIEKYPGKCWSTAALELPGGWMAR